MCPVQRLLGDSRKLPKKTTKASFGLGRRSRFSEFLTPHSSQCCAVLGSTAQSF